MSFGRELPHARPINIKSKSAVIQAPSVAPSHLPGDVKAIAAAAPPTAPVDKCGQRVQGGRVRVLSVDDDPVNQMVIQTLLTPANYEVRSKV